jgi:O-antigen/teichoic acid export membrane protein
MTIVFTVWGELLLNKFFGPSYGAGAGVLAILCTGQCINLALGQSMVALAMTGEQAVVTRIAVLSGALKIVLSVVLGYLAGAIGVAVASAVATAVAKLIGWSAARRRLNIDTRIRLSLVGLGLKHVYRSLNGYIQTRQM